ncbi:spermidine/putrescine ABC transporter substrate-binding protein [Streptomyces sp. NPDC051940]|uniref:polyamine ABC transporter substrate-binding protein n=1 Tax=Streptomyces sp. NPDC051940 TaxID=3155675 RepID=UPI0034241351
MVNSEPHNPPGPARRPRRGPDRRALLRAGLFAGSAGLLAACGQDGGRAAAAKPTRVSRPDDPVTLPLAADNKAIADGLTPEKGATLRLLNYADYLAPDLVKAFQKEYGCKVQVTTFTTMTEAVEKLRNASAAPYDVFFPTADVVGRVVQAGLLQPVNHSYLGNLANVWPTLQNPFYDQGSRYTVPYNVFSTGIGYRADRITSLPANGYDLFWDPAYAGKVYVLDDYREALALTLVRRGDFEVNTGDAAVLGRAGKDLAELLRTVKVKVGTQQATLLPQGQALVHQAWSGDMIAAQYNLAEDQPATDLGFWYPEQGKGVIGTDCVAVVRGAGSPVLAHHFLDYLLDTDNAGTNMGWVGYQPAQTAFTPQYMAENEYVPANLTSAIVTEQAYRDCVQLLQLDVESERLWQDTWAQFNAGS